MPRPGAAWEDYLRSRFPAYLLPESASARLSVAEAARFLERLTGRGHQLEVLRAVSVLSRRVEQLVAFVNGAVGSLAAALPSRTHPERREWQGAFHGRLLVAETMALHTAGRRTSFVTRSRRRAFDLPENILLRAVCARLLGVLTHLRAAGALPESGWGRGLRECEGALRRLLTSTALREVPDAPLHAVDEGAAYSARHEGYRQAAEWARCLREGLDDDDPARVARVVADGALVPLDDATRFELAVAIRLSEALEAAFESSEPGRWRVERALVVSKRRELVAFTRDDRRFVNVFYNQAVLPPGRADDGGRHYLGNVGRLRPDITLTFGAGEETRDAVVIECKHSSAPSYLVAGFHEALLYRHEYAPLLKGWPKAILVASGRVSGKPRRADDVVAIGWRDWPSPMLVEALVERARGD